MQLSVPDASLLQELSYVASEMMFVSEVFIGAWVQGSNLQEACNNTTTVIQLGNSGHGV